MVLFLHVTSHVDGEPYPDLLYENGGIGFPTVSFLDADGRLLQQVGNVVSLADCERAFAALQTWQALRQEVEGGSASRERQLELFRLELGMGNRPFAEMVQRRDALELTAEERAAAEQPLVNLQFTEILRSTPRTKDGMAAGGARFLQMFEQGRIPTLSTETSYWQYMFAHAKQQGDKALFQRLLDWLRAHRADDGRFKRYLRLLERDLEQMGGDK